MGIGSNLTLVNYATLSNVPSTFPANMTNIYTKTEVNGLTSLTNFYNKIDSDGRFLQLTGGTINGTLRAMQLVSGDATWQLLINGPTAAGAPPSIQTIQQGVGFNQNLTLQATLGNVGIGTSTNLTNKLNIFGTCSATIFSGSGARLTNIPYASITGLPSTFPADMTNIILKLKLIIY